MCIFCVTINKLVGNDGQEFNEPGVSIFEVSMYNVAQITYTDLASPSWPLWPLCQSTIAVVGWVSFSVL